MEFNREGTREFGDWLEAYVKEGLKQRYPDVTLAKKRGTFSGLSVDFKMAFETANEEGESAKEVEFKQYARSFGLQPEDYGFEFSHGGRKFKITGLLTGGTKYTIAADEISTGKGFKFNLDTIIGRDQCFEESAPEGGGTMFDRVGPPAEVKYTPIFTIRAATTGNPDHGQYAPISEPHVFEAGSMEELRAMVRGYIQYWSVGGGNWTAPPVKKNGKKIGNLSYNMRLYDGKGDTQRFFNEPEGDRVIRFNPAA
jgi:hypothetical protein